MCRLFLWLVASLLLVPVSAQADWKRMANQSEFQPPSREDWIRLQAARSARADCPHCQPPIAIPSEVIYQTPPCPTVRTGKHAPPPEKYGWRYPGPYYIPAQPKYIGVVEGCPDCGGRLRIYEAKAEAIGAGWGRAVIEPSPASPPSEPAPEPAPSPPQGAANQPHDSSDSDNPTDVQHSFSESARLARPADSAPATLATTK